MFYQSIIIDTSVVILNYNGLKWLEKFIPTFEIYSKNDASIYVIDNGSKDGSILFLKKNHPKINVISLSKNLGFAGGYNEGLKQINSKYYILVNSDV
ncbi:MAG: glycosyl transferase family 2, partial [Crocinitomicaceae bacterium]|nr:glycosyl transferase family 2 [Crocinitomicaceae bacterium]